MVSAIHNDSFSWLANPYSVSRDAEQAQLGNISQSDPPGGESVAATKLDPSRAKPKSVNHLAQPDNTDYGNGNDKNAIDLSAEDKELVRKLQQRDAEVRAHENAHKAAAGGLATGGPTYTTQRGPDGRAYAIGGEVTIDTSPGNTPEETIRKAQQIRAAALAPAEPSAQDMRVASKASQMEMEAQREIAAGQGKEHQSLSSEDNTTDHADFANARTLPANQEPQAPWEVPISDVRQMFNVNA